MNGINLSVRRGETLAVLGRSGTGKSVLLRLIIGLQKPDSGRICIHGQDIAGMALDQLGEIRMKMGFLFQHDALYDSLTVEQNVRFGLELGGENREFVRRTAARFIELVGLLGFEKVFPRQLSGGMKQRVALARVLAMSPKILLMDEPFGALDSFTRMEMQAELINLWRQQPAAVLFVTHDIEEAVYLADRIVVMTPRPGQVKTIVSVPISRPRHRTDPDFTEIRNDVLRQYERSSSNVVGQTI